MPNSFQKGMSLQGRVKYMSGDPKNFAFEVSPFQTLQGHKKAVLHAFFAHDGHLIISQDPCTIHVWKQEDHRSYVSHCTIETRTTYVAVSHNGRLIASIDEDHVFGNKVRLWSSDGTWMADLRHHDACNMIFSPDDGYLVVADTLGRITLWDVTTCSLLCESDVPPDAIKTGFNHTVQRLAFAPDGKRLAVQWYTKNGAVQVYEIEETWNEGNIQRSIRWSGSIAATLLAAESLVAGLAYSPDWQYIAVASDMECLVWLFDAFSLDLVRSFALPKSLYGIADLVFSADGKHVAVAHGDGTVWIWDVAEQDPLQIFAAHPTELYGYKTVIGSIDWSPNNKFIMTTGIGHYEFVDSVTGKHTFGEEDCTVKLWKIKKKPYRKED
jgi:WD40 repeat protein